MNPLFRRANDTDAAALAELWLRSYSSALPTVRRAHDDDAVRRWFADVVVPHRETWLAAADDTILGLLVLSTDELEQLYLDPAWQGKGLGDRFINLAKQRRPNGLELWTFQVNEPARRFYARHGFAEVEWTDGLRNEEQEPDVRSVWQPDTAGITRRAGRG
ncbi:GNAT family N-acetyltransferase [Nocardia sp. NPDC059240]|uniref:GNAT family N-acetyltransferase n=1 Tax=Nocardia sp. NPDC059240 TaxID=3346786 RepID=UPI0036926D2D